MDGGTALHAACWVGHAPLVGRILAAGRVPIDTLDATHGSTPLGWAAFGPMVVFLLILGLGWLYAYREGILAWK